MRPENRFFDDLARMVQGAAGVASGLRQEVDQMVKTQLERLVAGMDVVSRDEFEAVRAMALKALAEQEVLAERLARAEAALAALQTSGPQRATASTVAPESPPTDTAADPTQGA